MSFDLHFELAVILHCSEDHLFYASAVNSTEEHCSQFSYKIACHVFDEYFLVSCSLCWHQLICVRYVRCVPLLDLFTSVSVLVYTGSKLYIHQIYVHRQANGVVLIMCL